MSTARKRTISMVHFPEGDESDPQQLDEYLDSIDTAVAAKVGGSTGATDNRLLRSDGTGGLTLQATGITVDDSDNITDVAALTATTLNGTNVNKGGTAVAIVTQTGETTGIIEFPDNKDYKVVVNSPFARTINSITTICASGTCTVTGKINSTALGGTANSASTTEATQAHASDNAMAAGDDFVLAISANSSCEMLTITVKWTRTLS